MEWSFCPICGGEIVFGEVDRESSDRVHIKCPDGCGEYLLIGPQEKIIDALKTVGEEGRHTTPLNINSILWIKCGILGWVRRI